MRKYTLMLSVTVHVVAALALIIAPLFAAATLPLVRDTVAFVPATVTPPPSPPPPRAIGARTPASVSDVAPRIEASPIQAPDGIKPEAPPASGIRSLEAGDPGGGPVGRIGGTGVIGGDPLAPPMPPATVVLPQPPVRIGGPIVEPRKIRDVKPVYPAIAVASGKEGLVILEAVIGEDGSVRDVRVLRSVALLDQAAIDAVRQWRFTPTLLSGQPVPVVMTVTVNFKLN
jgi:periplasmic protein TonB